MHSSACLPAFLAFRRRVSLDLRLVAFVLAMGIMLPSASLAQTVTFASSTPTVNFRIVDLCRPGLTTPMAEFAICISAI